MNAKVEIFDENGPRRVRRVLFALLIIGGLMLMGAAVATVFALDASAATSTSQGAAHRYTLSGERIALFNIAGDVTLEAGTGSDVIVEVTPDGRDGDKLEVRTGVIAGHNTLRVVYPTSHVIYPEMQWGSRDNSRVRDDGTFGDFEKRGGWQGGGLHDFGFGSHNVTVSRNAIFGGGLEAWAHIHVWVPSGRSVEAHQMCGRTSATQIAGNVALEIGSGHATADGIHGSLVLDTGSGDVEARNIVGDVILDTGSGGVSVHTVKGGDVLVDTGSGGVEGDGIDAGTLNIDTGSGGVRLDGVRADQVKVDTGSGEVELGFVDASMRRLDVDTGSGGVVLRVPKNFGADIEMDSGSGGFDSDLPISIVRRDDSYLKGRIGDGRSKVMIDTGSGGVRLRTR